MRRIFLKHVGDSIQKCRIGCLLTCYYSETIARLNSSCPTATAVKNTIVRDLIRWMIRTPLADIIRFARIPLLLLHVCFSVSWGLRHWLPPYLPLMQKRYRVFSPLPHSGELKRLTFVLSSQVHEKRWLLKPKIKGALIDYTTNWK